MLIHWYILMEFFKSIICFFMNNKNIMKNRIKNRTTWGTYKQYANGLIVAGGVWLLLTILFFLNVNQSELVVRWKDHVWLITTYYTINSVLTLLAGIFLKRLNKIGLLFLIITSLVALSSFFIVDEMWNLFVWSVFAPFYLLILFFAFPPLLILCLGGIFFVGSMFVNLLRIWKRFKIIKYKNK